MQNGQTREQISIALFNLLSSAYSFKTANRSPEEPNQAASGAQPAMYLWEPDEDIQQTVGNGTAYGPDKYMRYFIVYVYAIRSPGDPVQNPPVSTLNNILDEIEAGMLDYDAPFLARQQLSAFNNGVAACTNVFISGKVFKNDGTITDKQMAMRIPITMICGA